VSVSVEVDGSDEQLQHQRLGKFVLLRPIRKGSGMGALSLALDVEARRIVVLKRLQSARKDGQVAARFRDEIQVSFRVAHPNLVRAIESGTVGEEVYLALDYIAGQDLEAMAERARRVKAPLPLGMSAAILRQLLRALEYAHAQVGFVHRDVSPSNIMVGYDGIARLVDYGFALFELKSSRTVPGMSAGTLGFLAPEQRVAGATADARADLFAVGALLQFVLTGLATFAGEDPRSKDQLKARLQDRGVILQSELLTFLWRALQQDPNDRFQSAHEMGVALDAALGEPMPDERALGDYVSRLFAVEKQAGLAEIERWRSTDWSRQTALPLRVDSVPALPLPPPSPPLRRGLVIAAAASVAVIAACMVLIVGMKKAPPPPMIVVSSPPPEPRVEQLPVPAPVEPEPIAPPRPAPPAKPPLTAKPSAPKPPMPPATVPPPKTTAPTEAELALLAKKLDEAKALVRAGEITAARTLYAELADDPHARAKANTALAELEYRQGNYEQAIARANAAMRAGVNAPAFFVRALAELKGDKPADAARDFQKVLNIEPANSDAKEGLRRAEEQMRRKP
jgi:serine/threonine-protein kinase